MKTRGSTPVPRQTKDPFETWIEGYSAEDLKKRQEADENIALISLWKNERKERPDVSTVVIKSAETKNLWLQWEVLEVKEGVLYKNVEGEYRPRLIVPRELRNEVLQQMHDNILSGHLGVKRTYLKTYQHCYWYQLKETVKDYIARCSICSKNKRQGKRARPPPSTIPVGNPMDCIATDLFGPLPKSEKGNRYILLLMDLFSKWTEILPVPDATAETCAKVILNEFIARFGCPLAIHSDQGRNYESELFQELCKILEIRKTRTSPRHPQGNGSVERFNQTLIALIRSYLKGKQNKWDENLGSLAGAYRASVHSSTGFTPNRVMLGREVRMPLDLFFPSGKTLQLENYGEFVTNQKEELQRVGQLVREKLNAELTFQTESGGLRPHYKAYQVGQAVFLVNEARLVGKCPKLQYPYKGPYVVIKKCSDLNYVIQLDQQGHTKLVHFEKLKECQSNLPSWIGKVQKRLTNL